MYIIDYIEFWAVRRCNLNCKGCSSCASLHMKNLWYLSPDDLYNDLLRLKELGLNFNTIAVLGGEPLLHPCLDKLFDVIKLIYPFSNVQLITNGILIPEMNLDFWYKCKERDINFRITFFPIVDKHIKEKIRKIMEKYNLHYKITEKKVFNKILVLNNKASFDDIIANCGCNKAYNLYKGYIARCPVPFVVEDLNNIFNVNFKLGGKLNIYKVKDGKDVVKFLENANISCYNCSNNTVKVVWEKVIQRPDIKDWLVY